MLNAMLLLTSLALGADPAAPEPTAPFEAPKYGVKVSIPKDWPVAEREKEDRVFVALIGQNDPQRPGVAACELAIAPENLDEYRTRIDANAKRANGAGGTLTRNEIVKKGDAERLETIREFRPDGGGVWVEVSVRIVANRQMYTFILNVDSVSYAAARTRFDAMVDSAKLTPPNTGVELLNKMTNRWVQREFRFALDLPKDWSPVLAPHEAALLFANGPAHGIWSDNVLVLAEPHRNRDLNELARDYPEKLRDEEPGCEVLSCRVVKQGNSDALETVVRTRRGPFSMTVIERRFRGSRLDYEVKYTVESKRFDALAPLLRKSLDSFGEVSGSVPQAADKAT